MPAAPTPPARAHEWQGPIAPEAIIDFAADLHLQHDDQATLDAWRRYLRSTPAQALFILGDLFEVWVGDDALDEPDSFEAQACAELREAAKRLQIFFMHGNRDFLIGPGFGRHTGIALLHDPTAIQLGDTRYLLSHGDALCLEDVEYQQFRALSRSPAWQQQLLQQPLSTRRQLGRSARAQSESRKSAGPETYADLDRAASLAWLAETRCTVLLHGHTHKPGQHDLGEGLQRIVLSDWDLQASPPRAQVLRWQQGQLRRVNL